MLTISKPLSAGQARTYHAQEFRNARENYYTATDEIRGQWHGRLATAWGLSGDVIDEHFHRLADGQHPITGQQLVRAQTPHRYTDERGKTTQTMEHRAGWDATFSAPKSVSLTALVAGDDRVRDAHRASVVVALSETERYVQARMGGNRPAETTGQWVAATFEHDSARPVDGYAAPQLHTHSVIFNLTQTESGATRAVQPRELYRSQQYATAVYRSELAMRLRGLGYEVERGASGQPEIRGYTQAYLDASSPRRQQIQDYLEREGRRGAGAAQIAAHQTREAKVEHAHEAMQRRHREMATAFGEQPARAVQSAHARGPCLDEESPTIDQSAVTYAKERNIERDAVVDERAVLRDALKRSMGEAPVLVIKAEFERRITAGEFIQVEPLPGAAARAFTTPEMIALERETIEVMLAGQHTQPPLVRVETREAIEHDYQRLSTNQRAAVQQVLASHDRITALEGVAGAGKTTALSAVRDAAEREGYVVEGLAPTSRAAQKLGEAGMETHTLQRHLTGTEERSDGRKRLYVLDESSLASTVQMHRFLHHLQADDRVLLVGDVRQHQAVEAGRPYQQLQEAGLETARLDDIVRQPDPAFKAVVEQLSRGEVRSAMAHLDGQGRVHEIADRNDRLTDIARAYTAHPEGTLVVSPDNQSRREINAVIHQALQSQGLVAMEEHPTRVLVARQELTGIDRQWAEQYAPGDVVRYTKGSATHDIPAGGYARVAHANAAENLLTVRRETGERVTYDPRRLRGVTVYRETDRAFAAGDRVQFTAPYREQRVANRELGTIERIDASGDVRVRLESGRTVAFKIDDHPHLDYGYAVTSHSSQGQTADRVLVHVDTERAGEMLVNRRLAYVAVSRGRFAAQIYTNDKAHLVDALSREVSHRSAIGPSRGHCSSAPSAESLATRRGPAEQTIAHR